MLSVYVPPICTGACPNGFHEDLEASSGVPEEQRYALCCLHRRPSFAASGQGKAERILSNSLGSPRIAGIFINYPKSLLEPTQNLVFLGFTINSVEKELSLPAEKLEKIVVEAKTMLKCHTVSAQSLAQLIGRMTAAILAVHPAPLQYQGLQHLEHLALRRKGYNGQVTLSLGARKDLHWWVENLATWNGRVVQEVTTDVVIETDTSKTGWGAFCQGILTGGCWNAQEAELHINSLEMLAAFYAIKAFIKDSQGISVLLHMDNMSVVTYVNRMGGGQGLRYLLPRH